MTGADRFYCVCCNRLEQAEHAELMFKTGYYRVLYPLGCCVSCHEKRAYSGADARLDAGTGDPCGRPFAAGAAGEDEDGALIVAGGGIGSSLKFA